jgi:formylglycine-generating enzyme required for sulfatase activity
MHGWGKIVAIPSGRFTFGGGSQLSREEQARLERVESTMGSRPLRTARLVEIDAFDIDLTEVTVEAYQRCMDAGACFLTPMVFEFCTWQLKGRNKHPLNCVGRIYAEHFCVWAGGRLPTEEDWEYAARGSDDRTWPWGHEFSTKGLCFNRLRSSVKTCAAGSSARDVSPFGVRDMAASLTEWTKSEVWLVKPEDDERGLGEGYAVVRGGGWADVEPMRASVNAESLPSWMDVRADRGFRCVYAPRP